MSDPTEDQPTARLGQSGLMPMRPDSRELPRIPDTPPDSAKSTARSSRPMGGIPGTAEDGGEPKRIKWVPHTHANPVHARFCYMCLYGALEGKEEAMDPLEATAVDELPSSVEMRSRGYLQVKDHVRQPADFRRNNLPASWLRGCLREVFGQTKNMVLEFNTSVLREDPSSPVSGGGSWHLIHEDEEKEDWKVRMEGLNLD